MKTRMQVQIKHKSTDAEPLTTNEAHYTSSLDAIRKIVEDEGILGLYSGINGSLIGVVSTNFAYFYWYSVIRTFYLSSQAIPKSPSIATELSLGALAGAVAQVFTIPVSVVTTRQQTQPKGDKKGLIDTGREVIDGEDGWSGLWRGLKASLVLVVNPAITYGAYQRLRESLFPGRVSLRPLEAFRGSIFLTQDGTMLIFGSSPRSNVKGSGNPCDATIDSCKGRSPIKTPFRSTRQAFQELCRGHVLHY